MNLSKNALHRKTLATKENPLIWDKKNISLYLFTCFSLFKSIYLLITLRKEGNINKKKMINQRMSWKNIVMEAQQTCVIHGTYFMETRETWNRSVPLAWHVWHSILLKGEGNINSYQMIRLNTILQLSHDGAFDSICHPCVRHLRIQFVVGKWGYWRGKLLWK